MAITRGKKEEIVAHIQNLLASSKMTVLVNYSGLNVKDFQELRRAAKEQGVKITVAKNRLVKLAVAGSEMLKDVDTSLLSGQIGMAFGLEDEAAPTQVLAEFAKTYSSLEFVGAYNAEGMTFDAAQVSALSKLPSKHVLRGQVVGTIAAPLSGFVGVLRANIGGLVNVLNARVEIIK